MRHGYQLSFSMSLTTFQTTGNILHFCSVGLKISALQPLTADPVLTWDQRVTSVAVTSTGHHTVALLGTQRGTLKKVSRDYPRGCSTIPPLFQA